MKKIILLFCIFYNFVVYADILEKELGFVVNNNKSKIEQLNKSIGQMYEQKGKTLFVPKIYATFSQGDLSNFTKHTTSLKAEYTIPLGGKAFHEYGKAKIISRLYSLEMLRAEQNILLDAIKTYLDVVCAEKLLSLSQKKMELLRQYIENAQEHLSFGEGTQLGVDKIKIKFTQEESEYFKLIRDLRLFKNKYKRIFGREPFNLIMPENNLPISNFDNKNIKDIAKKYNVELLMSMLQFRITKKDHISAVSGLWPNLTIGAEKKGLANQKKLGTPLIFSNNFYINLNWPIFSDGGLNFMQIKEAALIKNKAMYQSVDQLSLTLDSIDYSLNDLKFADSMLVSSAEAIKMLKEVLSQVKFEHNEGIKTILDVVSAEVDLFSAEVKLIEAKKLRIIIVYDILSKIGLLNFEYLNSNKNNIQILN